MADVPTPNGSDQSEAPAVHLGPGFEPIGFVAGRYAVLIARNMAGMHARNRVTHRSSASLVLELSGGSATACRGWQQAVRVSGPGVEQEQRFRLQQGFRGSYELRNGEVLVALEADDEVCREVREGDAPARAVAMTLRCVLGRPRGHAALTQPVLLCEWGEIDSSAYYAFAADGLAPGRWLVLGGQHGVRAHVTGKAISTEGAAIKVAIEHSTALIDVQAWDGPLPLPETTLEP